jgi:hypothetical protein
VLPQPGGPHRRPPHRVRSGACAQGTENLKVTARIRTELVIVGSLYHFLRDSRFVKKKKSNVPMSRALLLGLVVVGLAVVYYYYYVNPKSDAESTTSASASTPAALPPPPANTVRISAQNSVHLGNEWALHADPNAVQIFSRLTSIRHILWNDGRRTSDAAAMPASIAPAPGQGDPMYVNGNTVALGKSSWYIALAADHLAFVHAPSKTRHVFWPERGPPNSAVRVRPAGGRAVHHGQERGAARPGPTTHAAAGGPERTGPPNAYDRFQQVVGVYGAQRIQSGQQLGAETPVPQGRALHHRQGVVAAKVVTVYQKCPIVHQLFFLRMTTIRPEYLTPGLKIIILIIICLV